jgi:WD40 repeat protein
VFSHARKSPSSTPAASGAAAAAAAAPPPPGAAPNPAYGSDVAAARFFNLDRFVLLAAGARLHAYRFAVADAEGDDDIERLRAAGRYRCAFTHASPSQSIADVACLNSCISHVALLAGSNRSIEVVDLAAGRLARSLPDAHSRPVHTLAMCAPSAFVSHPREAHDLFASAAADGVVKLWDLRAARVVRAFTGHKAATVRAGVALSPCMRFLASGSEDMCCYLYDLRAGGAPLARPRTSAAVVDVAFSPLHPQLAAACLDGRVHFFSSSGGGA